MAKPVQFRGSLIGYERTFQDQNEAEGIFERFSQNNDVRKIWTDSFYFRGPDGQRLLSSLNAIVLEPEILFSSESMYATTPTGIRTFNIKVRDFGGEGHLNIKGRGSFLQGIESETRDFLFWQINRRRIQTFNDIVGKEVISQVDPEMSVFFHLLNNFPEIYFDVNAPIARPIAIFDRSGVIPTLESNEQITLEKAVIFVRRFPFTVNRLDEFVNFSKIEKGSLDALRNLNQTWGHENNKQTYLRAIERLGCAFKIFNMSGVLHNQIFSIVQYEEGSAAWFNFNNIALDGLVCDNDSCQNFNNAPEYTQFQLIESIGACIMYLMFVLRMNPELGDDTNFLGQYFHHWKKGFSDDCIKQIDWFASGGKNAVDSVVEAIDAYARLYESSVDTRPNANRSSFTYSGFIEHMGKDTWVPLARKVTSIIKRNRKIIGI